MPEDLGVAHDDRSTSGLSAGEQEGDRPSRTRSVYLALSKRNFDIPRRSLAEVVHIYDVVRQEFALLHVVRVVSDLAVPHASYCQWWVRAWASICGALRDR